MRDERISITQNFCDSASGIIFAGTKLLLLSGVVGAVMFIEVIILAVLFIIGTFIGDWLEEKNKNKTA